MTVESSILLCLESLYCFAVCLELIQPMLGLLAYTGWGGGVVRQTQRNVFRFFLTGERGLVLRQI